MDRRFNSSVGEEFKTWRVKITKELRNLIKSEEFVTTMDVVLDGLKEHIREKNLFDPDKRKVLCKGDDLEKVFGVCEFNIIDIKKLLTRIVFPLRSREGRYAFTMETDATTSLGNADSPMILYIPPSPNRSSMSDSADSVQGYETAYAKDSSDDFFESDVEFPSGILTVAETFEVEYEPNSETGDDSTVSCTDSDFSDLEGKLSSFIAYSCKTDSDQEFWADKSSDELDCGSDVEISESDRWKCKRCSSLNSPPNRFCLKCFETREGWLASEIRRRKHVNRKPRSKRNKLARSSQESSQSREDSSQNSQYFDLPSTSKESPSCENVVCEENAMFPPKSHSLPTQIPSDKLCLICCSKPINSSIIHGKYAHTISCYRCAKRLQYARKRCPICRRTIERVVYQIST